ncbi:MAG: hypothetical protein GY749_32415 [Desulfobacteraceae bacterium]|nr:hypothetical protein [Desulfobacteraceae bacterium]
MAKKKIDVFSIFKEQASGHIQDMTNGLLNLEKDPVNKEIINNLMRIAHTLKGAARAMEFDGIKSLAHVLEDQFVQAGTDQLIITPAVIDDILAAVDIIKHIFAHSDVAQMKTITPEITDMIGKLKKEPGAAPVPAVPETPPPEPPARAEPMPAEPLPSDEPPPSEETKVQPPSLLDTGLTFQVRTDALDRMLGYTGELNVIQQLSSEFAERFQGYLEQTIQLGAHIKNLAFRHGSGEFIRMHKDDLGTIIDIEKNLREILATGKQDMEYLSTRLFHTGNGLEEEVVNARLKTLDHMFSEFPRMVRDLAREHNKEIRLDITGHKIKIDKAVLDVIKYPMMHLLRNAVGHGIEPPGERNQLNKEPEGRVTISAHEEKGQIMINVEDDGQGIDYASLRRKAASRRNLARETVDRL